MTSFGVGDLIRQALSALIAFGLAGAVIAPEAGADVERFHFAGEKGVLRIEVLDEDLIHFEWSIRSGDVSAPIFTTPQVFKTDYAGAAVTRVNGTVLETAEALIDVDINTLCFNVSDIARNWALARLCPVDLEQDWKGFQIDAPQLTHLYGLGQQFVQAGNANGDWVGRSRTPGDDHGNQMIPFNGGGVGNTQFPILYGLGEQGQTFGLFLDQVYKQSWDFETRPWVARMWGDQIRGYLLLGPDLKDVRSDYLELVGRPILPPRKAFGLWMSQYGFDDWSELDKELSSLRKSRMPIDGFVMDLQWFGNVVADSDLSPMGSLTWDRQNFPEPEKMIKSLKDQGIGMILIEESYVSRGLPEHEVMESKGYMAKDCADQSCKATYIQHNAWWGKGGMIDWSNPGARSFWHDWKRKPLVEMGVLGHWTDLGEPEMYNSWAWYHGFPELGKFRHPDVHNVFSLFWHQGIYEGYVRSGSRMRPWMLSRAGAPGSQRYGAGMWSGDIGSNLRSLAAHYNAQMHMSLSGMDYYGSDVGGFHRSALEGDLNEMYTQWFAGSAALDIPLRPHTENLCNCKQTAPDKIGDARSNLFHLRQRYELIPYYYSLAHRAHQHGEAIFPPLVYEFPLDPRVREMGHQKLIGRDLMVAIVAAHGETSRDVYLPTGRWINYHSGVHYDSVGGWLKNVPVYADGVFKLPYFVRAGAILPKMHVDEKTLNSEGKRADGSRRDELVLKVYPNEVGSEFAVYEDDGQTTDYAAGQLRRTRIEQRQTGDQLKITVHAADGTFSEANSVRGVRLEIVTLSNIGKIWANGEILAEQSQCTAENAPAHPGWCRKSDREVWILLPEREVQMRQEIRVTLSDGNEQIQTVLATQGRR